LERELIGLGGKKEEESLTLWVSPELRFKKTKGEQEIGWGVGEPGDLRSASSFYYRWEFLRLRLTGESRERPRKSI